MPESRLVPIYDATAPIACTITDAEIPERVALVERIRARHDRGRDLVSIGHRLQPKGISPA
jgi:hypothetical protein